MTLVYSEVGEESMSVPERSLMTAPRVEQSLPEHLVHLKSGWVTITSRVIHMTNTSN